MVLGLGLGLSIYIVRVRSLKRVRVRVTGPPAEKTYFTMFRGVPVRKKKHAEKTWRISSAEDSCAPRPY